MTATQLLASKPRRRTKDSPLTWVVMFTALFLMLGGLTGCTLFGGETTEPTGAPAEGQAVAPTLVPTLTPMPAVEGQAPPTGEAGGAAAAIEPLAVQPLEQIPAVGQGATDLVAPIVVDQGPECTPNCEPSVSNETPDGFARVLLTTHDNYVIPTVAHNLGTCLQTLEFGFVSLPVHAGVPNCGDMRLGGPGQWEVIFAVRPGEDYPEGQTVGLYLSGDTTVMVSPNGQEWSAPVQLATPGLVTVNVISLPADSAPVYFKVLGNDSFFGLHTGVYTGTSLPGVIETLSFGDELAGELREMEGHSGFNILQRALGMAEGNNCAWWYGFQLNVTDGDPSLWFPQCGELQAEGSGTFEYVLRPHPDFYPAEDLALWPVGNNAVVSFSTDNGETWTSAGILSESDPGSRGINFPRGDTDLWVRFQLTDGYVGIPVGPITANIDPLYNMP